MSDTRPDDGAQSTADASPEFREPGAIDYEAAPRNAGSADGSVEGSAADGANSEITAEEVHEHRPVTAEPPAVDGVTVDQFGEEESASSSPAASTGTSTGASSGTSTGASTGAVASDEFPAPVAADTVKRATYVPAATVGGTGAATLAPADTASSNYQATSPYAEYTPAAPAASAPPFQQTPIYVQAPTAPKNRGNRGAGILIALLATLVYAALYAAVAFVIAAVNSSTVGGATTTFTEFLVRPVYYIPVIFFFLAFSLLVALVNRGGWWAYVLFGFLVAVVVYFSYIGGALLTQAAWNFTPEEAGRFVASLWLNPAAIAAAVIAREVPIWFGAWIARRGRKVTARNAEARAEYERQIAEGPQLARPA